MKRLGLTIVVFALIYTALVWSAPSPDRIMSAPKLTIYEREVLDSLHRIEAQLKRMECRPSPKP
jgi:hypothetical protein